MVSKAGGNVMEETLARIDRLERLITELDARVVAVEMPKRPQPEAPVEVPKRFEPPPPRVPRRAATGLRLNLGRDDLEDLLGGRVLAWVGGLAVLVGIVFLFALAASSGWIGETARVALGAAGSAGLLALGVWIHERKSRSDAALAAVAAGISGLFVTITVATQVYDLLPPLLGAVLVVGAGAAATTLSVLWESRGVAGLGILGAVAAPILAGAAGTGGTMAILFVALASASAVLLWQRWDWLALGAFTLATPQWVYFATGHADQPEILAVLLAFGVLGVVVALGHDLRIRAERLRASSVFLLALNALVAGAVGWYAFTELAGPGAGNAWVAAVALVHLGVGFAGRRLGLTGDVRLLSLAIGAVAGNVAFGLFADGLVLSVVWAASAVGFAALVRRLVSADPAEAVLAQAGLGGHLALTLVNAIALSDPGQLAAGDHGIPTAGAIAIGVLAAGCLASARIAAQWSEGWRVALDTAGLLAVGALTVLTLDGLALALAWACESVALAAIARRANDNLAAYGAAGFLTLAACHALMFEGPPVSLVTGLADPVAAIAALGAVAGSTFLFAAWATPGKPKIVALLKGAAALAALYLASALVVTPFESDAAMDSALLSAHQQGQMVLSVFWALVGVGTIVVGLRRDIGLVRIAGLALLGLTATKVFLFDLATLTSVYRVISFIALGVLLLGAALVWQWLRPRALEDLREVPTGMR
jgi:uncharacterized membrane protein